MTLTVPCLFGLESLVADEMRRLNDSIQDVTISAQIERLSQVSDKIFQQVQKNPSQLPQIRRFMNYYLPTLEKLMNTYIELSNQKIKGENIKKTLTGIEGILDVIKPAF